jgi:hypothetical protein
MHGQFTRPIITNSNEKVEPVAVPLDPNSPAHRGVDKRKDSAANNRASRMRDIARKGSSCGGRLDKLDIETPEANERSKVSFQSRKGPSDRLEHGFSLLVRRHPHLYQRRRRDLNRHGAGRPIV